MYFVVFRINPTGGTFPADLNTQEPAFLNGAFPKKTPKTLFSECRKTSVFQT